MQPVSPQNDQEEKRIDSGVVDDDTVTATTDVKMEDVGGAVVEDGSSSRMVETPPPAAAEKTTKDTWPWRRTSQDGSDAGGDHEDGSSRSPLSEPVGSSITTGRRAAAQGSFSAVETATMTGGGDPTAIEESSSRDIRSSPSDDVLSASHPASFLRAEQEEDVGATEDVKVEKGERSTTTPVSQDEGKSSTTEMMVKQEGLDETPSSTSVTAADQERRGSHPLPQPSTSADAVSSDKQQEQQEIKESTPTDHASPPSTSSPGSAAAPETRPIDMARLMNSIEATRRAAELQQRLSAVATRGSGSALDPPHSPSHGLSASPFNERLPPSSSPSMSLLRKRKSTAQLSVSSQHHGGAAATTSSSPPPPMPSMAPRPIAAIPGSPASSAGPHQGRRLVTSIAAPSSPGAPSNTHRESLVSPLRSRFDRMAPFRPRSPPDIDSASAPLRRGSSDARVTSSSISPPMPPPSWSPAMMRRMSSTSSGGAQTRSSSPGMDVDSSPRAKRSRLENSGRLPQTPSGGQFPPASPRVPPSYRRPSTTSQDVLLAETGLVTPGGSTQGLQQRILGHRRVASGSAFAHASPPPIFRQGPIRTLDDLERAGTLHPTQRAPSYHPAPPMLASHGSSPEVRRLSNAGMHPMSPNGRVKKHRSQSHSVFSGARPSAALLAAPYAKPDKMDLDAANALTSMLGGSPLVRARSNTIQGSRQAAFLDAQERERTPGRSMPDVFDEEEVLMDRRDSRTRAERYASPPRRAVTPSTPSRRHAPTVPSTAPPLYRADSSRKLEDESSDEDKKAAELMIFLAQSPSPLKRDATPAMARKSSVSATPGGIGRILFEDSLDGKKRGMAGLALEDSPRVRGGITPARKLSDLMDAPINDAGKGGECGIKDLERDFPPIGASVPMT